ncbi:SDR family NAD(P)-dependent oxidoreductase [Streptomyces sp. NBC_01426]|uniref:SDR family NAD(P)-dependent oxidoreductase n=1 Tax=Streptomyces sp. NBC_01426 TaxID=2975866 RepID=UPI003FCE9600
MHLVGDPFPALGGDGGQHAVLAREVPVRRSPAHNLFGHIAVTQALMPALLRAKGRVINIGSVGGKVATATYGAYALIAARGIAAANEPMRAGRFDCQMIGSSDVYGYPY